MTAVTRAPEPLRVPFSALSTFAFVLVSVVVIHTVSGTPNVLLDIPPLPIPTTGLLNVFLTQDAQGAYQFISSEPC